MRNWIDIITEGHGPEYRFVSTCTQGGHGPVGEAIHDMTDKETPISFDEFKKACSEKQLSEVFPQYKWEVELDPYDYYDDDIDHDDDDNLHGGMTMGGDYTMKNAFFRSQWYGIECVFCVWSAIEYIFTRNGDTPESLGIDREEYLFDLD